ncbi:MAG: hypothetical protein ACRDAM_06495 [Casimicrobium sp.]
MPPFWWRTLFWALLSACLASIVVAAFSFIVSLGFGIIGLFAGSLEGFTKFSLSTSQLAWLFWTPLALLMPLYVIRHFIRPRFVIASRSERILGFAVGTTIGAISMFLIASSLLGHR